MTLTVQIGTKSTSGLLLETFFTTAFRATFRLFLIEFYIACKHRVSNWDPNFVILKRNLEHFASVNERARDVNCGWLLLRRPSGIRAKIRISKKPQMAGGAFGELRRSFHSIYFLNRVIAKFIHYHFMINWRFSINWPVPFCIASYFNLARLQSWEDS